MKMRENPFTQVLEFRLTTASSGRKLLSFFLLLYRLIAAALLLYVGSFFLVYTVNITDLILNTVSLGIILDIDNYIFAALATTAGKSLMYLRCTCGHLLNYNIGTSVLSSSVFLFGSRLVPPTGLSRFFGFLRSWRQSGNCGCLI